MSDFEYLIYTNRLLHITRQLSIAHKYKLDPTIMLNKLESFIMFYKKFIGRR